MRSPSSNFWLTISIVTLCACTTQSLKEGDHDLVLKIGQLQSYGLSLPESFTAYESFSRQRWIDGSVVIEYEFSAPEDLGLPYLYSTAERHRSKSDACLSFSAGNLGARLGGMELSERNDLFRFGDKSRFGLLVDGGSPYGNFFSMCRGEIAFMIMLGGFYVDDGDTWKELLKPTLEALESWR